MVGYDTHERSSKAASYDDKKRYENMEAEARVRAKTKTKTKTKRKEVE